jgi:hypothetical protein
VRSYSALIAGAILVLSFLASPSPVAAFAATNGARPTQPSTSDSARFVGEVTVDGNLAPDASTIVAMVGETTCGFGVVTGGLYRLDVVPADAKTGCGSPGSPVVFVRGALSGPGGPSIGPTGAWDSTRENYLDLSFTTLAAARSEALPAIWSDVAPWLLGALGTIALLSGTLLERRRLNRD